LEIPVRYSDFKVRESCLTPYYGSIVFVFPWLVVGIVLDWGDIRGRIVSVLGPFARAFWLLLGRCDALGRG